MGGLFELFSNNLINWIVLLVLVAILWNKMMPALFAERRRKIETSLQNAASHRQEGQKFLEDQQLRIANAEKEADQILVEAKAVAERMTKEMADETKKLADALGRKYDQQITAERQIAITQLRSQAATVAVRIAESSLPGAITPGVKSRLQDQFVQQLDQVGNIK